MFKKIILTLIILVLLVSARPAHAQTLGEGLTISPPIFELTLKPGETTTQTIKITNPTANLMEVYPQAMNFTASGESGEPAFLPVTSEEEKFSLGSWIKFTQTKIALTPQQVVEWQFQIVVPPDAEPGGHYGVVFLGTEPPKAEQNISQVAIASMIGSLVLVRAPGAIAEKGVLEEFIANKFFFKPPVQFTLRIQNQGNVHFKPNGEITIKDWWGKIADKVTVNQAKGNVLPESTRKFEEKWLPKTGNWWTIGRFKANLSLTYGESNQSLTGSLVFWVVPWWLIIILVALLGFIIGMIIRRRKRNKPPQMPEPPRERRIIIR